MILPHRALRYLARKRFAGFFRKQGRRLKTPSGFLFALVGFGVIGLWVSSIVWSQSMRTDGGTSIVSLPPDLLPAAVGVSCLLFAAMSMLSALGLRGLYMPKEEIELLLSAPVSRADVVRYRLVVMMARSLVGSLLLAVFTFSHMPHPGFAFAGVLLASQTLPIVNQSMSLVAGDAENRAFQRLPRWLFKAASVTGGLVVGLFLAFLILRNVSRVGSRLGVEEEFRAALSSPLLETLTIPVRPWVRMITATETADFLLWGGICVALWVLLFELTARIKIDFRELSLETSSDIARRIQRMRRGGGGVASTAKAVRGAGSRVPWFFGHGPFGAIAWRKTASITRKARSAFLTSATILLTVTIFITFVTRSTRADSGSFIGSSLLVAVLGTMYLSMGLRFDFRDDLDQMETIKSFPLSPRKIFLATVLPQALVVSMLVAGAVVIRMIVLQTFEPWVFVIVAALPPATFLWLAIDNAVFLYAPIRFVPGQEGFLQNAGRAVVLLLLRMLVLGVVVSSVAAVVGALILAHEFLGLEKSTATALAVALGFVCVLAVSGVLVALGGLLFRRFDVARDRG